MSPHVPATDGGDGTPDKMEAGVDAAPVPNFRVAINDPQVVLWIEFERDSVRPNLAALAILNAVSEYLQRTPQLQLLEVDGFSYAPEDRHPTVSLSLRRAQFAVHELVKRGTDPSRLRAVGLGPYCRPPDGPPFGGARMLFHVVRLEGQTVGWGGCAEAEAHGIARPPGD